MRLYRLLLFGCLLGFPSFTSAAQTAERDQSILAIFYPTPNGKQVTPWTHPGAHSYKGTLPEALRFFISEGFLTPDQAQLLVTQYEQGDCYRGEISENYAFYMTFTKDGKSRAEYVRAQTDDWAYDTPRGALVCHNDSIAYSLVLPDVCGNWALFIPPGAPPVMGYYPPPLNGPYGPAWGIIPSPGTGYALPRSPQPPPQVCIPVPLGPKTNVPEPPTFAILAAGLVALFYFRRRKSVPCS